jgi:hypothetical protein
VKDAWDDSLSPGSRFSVITFGTPTALYQQSVSSTVKPRQRLRSRFINIIDPDDIVPFVYNIARTRFATLKKELKIPDPLPRARELLLGLLRAGTQLTIGHSDNNDGRVGKLLLGILHFLSPDSTPGAHIGRVILRTGPQHFLRISENESATMQRLIIAGEHNNMAQLLRTHSMVAYFSEWKGFVDLSPTSNHPRALGNRGADDLRMSLLPAILNADARQSIPTKIEYRIFVKSSIAPNIFEAAKLCYQIQGDGGVLEEEMKLGFAPAANDTVSSSSCFHKSNWILMYLQYPCFYFVLSQTEVAFSFVAAEDFSDKAWLAVLSGRVELVDCFGFSHPVTLPLGIECPPLTDLRNPGTNIFPKHAMLWALVAQVSHTMEYESDQEVTLCNKARLICEHIDALVGASSPELFCANLRIIFDEVDATWRTTLVDEVDIETQETEVIRDFVPNSAKGAVRRKLIRLLLDANPERQYGEEYRRVTLSEVERRKPGHFLKCFKQVPRVPSFGKSLAGYASVLQAAKGSFMDGPSRRIAEAKRSLALNHLRLSMIVIHAIINSQIFPPPTWLLDYTKPPQIALLWDAGLTFLISAIGVLFTADHALVNTLSRLRPKEPAMSDYGKLIRAAFAIAVADEQQELEEQFPGNAAAEIRLRVWSESRISDIKEMIGNPVGTPKWPCPFPPSTDYALWFLAVAQLGRLRHIAGLITNIGAIGPSRVGKSELMTAIFDIDRSVFNPGADDQARTLDVRAYRSGQLLLLDCPGLNEGSETARYATSFVMDLLHVFIVVLDYKEAATETTKEALRSLAGQLVERKTQPFRIILNRVDEAISPRTSTDPDHWARDINARKQHVIRELQRQFNNRDYVETLISRPHPTFPDRRFSK